jgi:hypothetical protein
VELYEPSERLVGFYAMVAKAAEAWDGPHPVRILSKPRNPTPQPHHPPTHLACAYVPMCPCACSSPTTTRSSPTP